MFQPLKLPQILLEEVMAMVTKQVLTQYADLKIEVNDLRKKISILERQIPNLEQRIAEIEAGETVKDKVYGGAGGEQGFNIEGIPVGEYNAKKMDLIVKKDILAERKSLLKTLELELLMQINEIEKFVRSIPDSHIRNIIRLRVVDGKTWNEVADVVGGGNTEDSVKKAFHRYLS